MVLPEVSNNNIQIIFELFKHYGIKLNKETPDENGNILCIDCENSYKEHP